MRIIIADISLFGNYFVSYCLYFVFETALGVSNATQLSV